MPQRNGVPALCLVLAIALCACYPTEPGISSDTRFLEVRAGGKTACVLTDKGPTLCWGDNAYGQLGNGTFDPSLVPGPMALGPRFIDISPGTTTCALDQEGAPLCWGDNRGGTDIKDGSDLTAPQAILTQQRFVRIFPGCGLDESGNAGCWGGSTYYHGTGDPLLDMAWGCLVTTEHELRCADDFYAPTGDLIPVREVEMGDNLWCVLADDDTPYCWGAVYGAGADTAAYFEGISDAGYILSELSGERKYTSISVGERHGCGLDANGFASCWGDNSHGQIGDGTTNHAMVSGALRPTPVNGSLRFRSIAAGDDFTCGVTQDFQLYCWGLNDLGQLGNGTTMPSLLPRLVTLPAAES